MPSLQSAHEGTKEPPAVSILVVEDDPAFRMLLGTWLRLEGTYDLHEADSLAAAQAAVQGTRFDLVLLDLHLPDSSGMATLRTLQGVCDGVPVVVLTGQDDAGQGVVAVREGAQNYLPKEATDAAALARELRHALERRRLEALRRRALEHEMEVRRLRELDQAKDQFYRAAASSLHDPLAPLRWDLQVLRCELHEHVTPRQKDALDSVAGHLDRLEAMVSSLVDVAASHAGTLILERRPLDLGRLLQDVSRRFEDEAHANRLSLDCVAPAGVLVEGDARRLGRVGEQLLENAVRNTPGGGCVRVLVEADAEQVAVAVRDSGVGMDSGQLRHAFDPFEDPSGGRPGLGLAYCKAVVERHGGSLEVQSDPGDGTEVRFGLPRYGHVG